MYPTKPDVANPPVQAAYAPPAQPYGPPVQQQHFAPQTVPMIAVGQAPVVVLSVGPSPATVTCPQCHKTVTTHTRSEANKTAHIAALVLCLIGCWFCCCIPYCMDSFHSVHHTCPKCKAFIGTYKQ